MWKNVTRENIHQYVHVQSHGKEAVLKPSLDMSKEYVEKVELLLWTSAHQLPGGIKVYNH